MRCPDRDRRVDVEDVLPDRVWVPLYGKAVDLRGVVSGVHVRGGAAVSAAQFELNRRSFPRWVSHRRRVLHRDMGGVGGGGAASECVVQPDPIRNGNCADLRCAECAWDHCFCFQRA